MIVNMSTDHDHMLKKWWSHSRPNINDINSTITTTTTKRDSNHMPNLRLIKFIYFTFSTWLFFRFTLNPMQPNPIPSPVTSIIWLRSFFVMPMSNSPIVCSCGSLIFYKFQLMCMHTFNFFYDTCSCMCVCMPLCVCVSIWKCWKK